MRLLLLGHRLLLERDCIWEVFQPEPFEGQILCGPQIIELAELLGDADLFPVAGALTVQPGDPARIIVAQKGTATGAWSEKLWTQIKTISPTGQVITAIVTDEPQQSDRHELVAGSVVLYNRDCIIGV